ncbi:hypothetical protein [Janthinobacterium sp.]|uniref:hypothetical protein n=1 Tax=Janthinobacterium sp. TaxID=1871054 RepID=UPI00293D5673|nr:hypothetical protein [Janthinobacterium sp.]
MTTKINLVLFQPDTARYKILDSYLEVIESLRWGLEALGYRCGFMRNRFEHDAVNIFFGWIPALQMGALESIPANSIFYNLEQMAVGSMRGAVLLEQAAARFQIWDYSAANLANWAELNPRFPVYHAPVAYAPTLECVPAGPAEDIDLLYVGSVSPKRAEKLATASSHNSSLLTLGNVWGAQRDAFIGRAKVLLNVSHDRPAMNIFEVVRVSYYLANRKAVVCESYPGQHVEADMLATLRFAAAADLGEACDALLADAPARAAYAEAGYEMFRQRDVRAVLRGFFN